MSMAIYKYEIHGELNSLVFTSTKKLKSPLVNMS